MSKFNNHFRYHAVELILSLLIVYEAVNWLIKHNTWLNDYKVLIENDNVVFDEVMELSMWLWG